MLPFCSQKSAEVTFYNYTNNPGISNIINSFLMIIFTYNLKVSYRTPLFTG